MKKREKGSATLLVVITVILIIVLLGVIYGTVVAKRKSQLMETKELFDIYDGNMTDIYDEQIAKSLNGNEENNQLPELTADTAVGTIVRLPDKWATEAARYISTSTGYKVTSVTKVASVYAVSIGGGESVPVPYGFYYVGGNLSNGVIISDNEADKYDGTTDKTTFAYTTSLVGNQFVWIPCTTNAYVKTDWGKQNANWDNTTPKAEVQQIEKYGGFYVGRYEAGLASTIPEFTTNQTYIGSNQVYNLDGVPQSKAGIVPWNFIDWTHAKANAESMYNNNYVSSGLITGTQWDVILNTMKSKAGLSDSDITNSNSWGNYMNTEISYTGRKATAYKDESNWIIPPFGSSETGTTTDYTKSGENNTAESKGDSLTTGASDTTQKYHIFDIAGNLWEWTEEDSHKATTGQYRVYRGGGLWDKSSASPACHRYSNVVSCTGIPVGFRAVLYIK